MRLTLERVERDAESGRVVVRLVALNDSFEAVTLDRGLLVGPNPVLERPTGLPLPISVEPTTGGPEDAVTLNPWCFFGRERTFDAGEELTFHGFLLRERTDELRPDGPVNPDALAAAATALRVG